MKQQSRPASHPSSHLLAVYLNDHLAGASFGVELMRRIASAHRGRDVRRELAELAGQVAEDRQALLELMGRLGVHPRPYKAAGGWLAEKAGRLKFNGRLLHRSPLSDVLELEAMRLGVEGKALCWRSLRVLADSDARLDAAALDRLTRRAERQIEVLEGLRLRLVVPVLTPDGRTALSSAAGAGSRLS